MLIARLAAPLEVCSALEQELQQGNLHAGPLGMNARSRQAERCAVATVRLGFRVDVRARVEQQFCDGNDVRRRLLTKILDAISRSMAST